jgi:membrane protease YdiL (CAAX protease family)
VLILLNMVRGNMTIGYVAMSLVGNSLRNGLFEEFLFRGALLTRLSRLYGIPWGIDLSSLLFGFWHLGAALGSAQGNVLVALAMTTVAQGMVGLGWAVAFVRTRNLLAPSVIHVLFNVSQL